MLELHEPHLRNILKFFCLFYFACLVQSLQLDNSASYSNPQILFYLPFLVETVQIDKANKAYQNGLFHSDVGTKFENPKISTLFAYWKNLFFFTNFSQT